MGKYLQTASLCVLMGLVPTVVLASTNGADPDSSVYVSKTAVLNPDKAKAEAPKIAEVQQKIPQEVTLVDSEATPETIKLYSYLYAVGKMSKVLYGHQNDTHHKAFLQKSASWSDTQDVTGSAAAICGIDALSFVGAEMELTPAEQAQGITFVDKAASLSIETAKNGAIITLSCHMPNFEVVKQKGKGADGKYNYGGYLPGDMRGNVVPRILPGGDLNDVYKGYLDLVAEYAHKLAENNVPIIFRPFHENNGSWFWWGAKAKNAGTLEERNALVRYTVEYLRDTKQVHNFLYAYSPNGPFRTDGEYFKDYPGDEYMDILGVDYYDDNPPGPAQIDPWFPEFQTTVNLLGEAAKTHHKLAAITEAGVRDSKSLAVAHNKNMDWFSNVSAILSKAKIPYFLTWANFTYDNNFYEPYMVSETRGHEMINKFIDYYNEENSVFADGVENYRELTSPIVRNKN
jgi:mannan endo-1,4-beta-mannosidase